MAYPAVQFIFFYILPLKPYDFTLGGGGKLLNVKYVFSFSVQLSSETLLPSCTHSDACGVDTSPPVCQFGQPEGLQVFGELNLIGCLNLNHLNSSFEVSLNLNFDQ